MTATFPQSGYQEIGIFESAGAALSDARAFRKAIQKDICAAGGDLVATEVNGYGQYVRGVVFRKTGAP